MAISLWCARMERALTDREESAMMLLLPSERRARLERVRKAEKRQEVLCAYTILQLAVREECGWRSIPRIELSSMGKPGFAEHPDVHFNLSHTTGAVLIGLSDEPIGVDIERIRPVSLRAMQRIAGVESEKAFFQSWVRREARAKRAGTGVGTLVESESPLQYGEHFYYLDTFEGYVAGVATRSNEPPGKVRRYFLDELL